VVVGALGYARVVLISGARQVGKTTLGTEIAAADHPMRMLGQVLFNHLPG